MCKRRITFLSSSAGFIVLSAVLFAEVIVELEFSTSSSHSDIRNNLNSNDGGQQTNPLMCSRLITGMDTGWESAESNNPSQKWRFRVPRSAVEICGLEPTDKNAAIITSYGTVGR